MGRSLTIILVALLLIGVLVISGCGSTSGQAYNVPQYGGGGCGVSSNSLAPVVQSLSQAVGSSVC